MYIIITFPMNINEIILIILIKIIKITLNL